MSRSKLPAPLTTPDIDCRKLAGFMLNTERILASELWALSTGEELKAALALWCRGWKQIPAASLPNDDRVLASFAGATPERWGAIREVAMRGWILCADNRWYHPVLCDEARRAFAKRTEYLDECEKTKERMRRMRARQKQRREAEAAEREAKRDRDASVTRNEQSNDTRHDRVMCAARDGTESRPYRDEDAAAAAAAPPTRGATASPARSASGALGPDGAAHTPAAAAASRRSVDPEANTQLRAILGKVGFPADPQSTCEWEGMFRRQGLMKANSVRSFLVFYAAMPGVPDRERYARFAEKHVALWREGAPT